MNTRGEIKARLKTELEMVSTSTLFADATLEDAIWDAYLWATDRHPWPRLERASFTTTTGDQYYDQPTEFKADSVFLIVINNQPYKPIEYEDYLRFRTEYPNNSTEFMYAMFGSQLFLEPIATAGIEMVVWGLIQPDAFVNDSSFTIFSNSEEAVNEGIMRKALSDLLTGDANKANNELLKAQSIVDNSYANIRSRRARFQRKNAQFYDVPDFFPSSNIASRPGNFRGV